MRVGFLFAASSLCCRRDRGCQHFTVKEMVVFLLKFKKCCLHTTVLVFVTLCHSLSIYSILQDYEGGGCMYVHTCGLGDGTSETSVYSHISH